MTDLLTDCFTDQIREINPRLNLDLIEKAYKLSLSAHKDQKRKSGEPYIRHPMAVAIILAEQKLDSVTIAAALLHDVLEDTPITLARLIEDFGEEIAQLVDGVTKIRTFEIKNREERQAETYRKMLLSMAKDIRVIIIKFADRLHNLRTLDALSPERIAAIASETLDIYAPLAHRLGMAKIKWELEDLAFKYLYPEDYKNVVAKVVGSRNEREKLIDSFTIPLRQKVASENITATIIGRPKHFYSIYRKMANATKSFEEIYDLLAIRVITSDLRACYAILGLVHSLWKPIADRFKDYISMPKSNGYQSLHTTVVGDSGNIVEIQIRTWEMNQVAEDGIAAHWLYKEGENSGFSTDDHQLAWLKNLIEWQKDLTDSAEFVEFFKIDLYHAEIFVFTPKGDLISLPKGATVLDFAFAVHTDLGIHCVGAKVDGKIEPLNTLLRSGFTVDILHSNSKTPSIDWLTDVHTPKGRSALRRWFKNTGKRESIDLGKKILRSHFNKLHLASPFSEFVPTLLSSLGINHLERLYELIGNGELPVARVMRYLNEHRKHQSMPSRVVSKIVNSIRPKSPGIIVGDTDNVMVRFANCCNPIPGDPITGFVTRGRGIVVHHADCPNLAYISRDEERLMSVSWDDHHDRQYFVSLEILATDRSGLLHDVTGVFSNFGADVIDGSLTTVRDQVRNIFKLKIQNKNQLKQIIDRLQKIKGIEKVTRTRDAGYGK